MLEKSTDRMMSLERDQRLKETSSWLNLELDALEYEEERCKNQIENELISD